MLNCTTLDTTNWKQKYQKSIDSKLSSLEEEKSEQKKNEQTKSHESKQNTVNANENLH